MGSKNLFFSQKSAGTSEGSGKRPRFSLFSRRERFIIEHVPLNLERKERCRAKLRPYYTGHFAYFTGHCLKTLLIPIQEHSRSGRCCALKRNIPIGCRNCALIQVYFCGNEDALFHRLFSYVLMSVACSNLKKTPRVAMLSVWTAARLQRNYQRGCMYIYLLRDNRLLIFHRPFATCSAYSCLACESPSESLRFIDRRAHGEKV